MWRAVSPLVNALTDELRRHVVLHADETPVAMLKPGKGKTHKAYIWSYCTPKRGVVIDNPPEAQAFSRWQEGKFLDLEREHARAWRAAHKEVAMAVSIKGTAKFFMRVSSGLGYFY
jgi:hypothetical protein